MPLSQPLPPADPPLAAQYPPPGGQRPTLGAQYLPPDIQYLALSDRNTARRRQDSPPAGQQQLPVSLFSDAGAAGSLPVIRIQIVASSGAGTLLQLDSNRWSSAFGSVSSSLASETYSA